VLKHMTIERRRRPIGSIIYPDILLPAIPSHKLAGLTFQQWLALLRNQ